HRRDEQAMREFELLARLLPAFRADVLDGRPVTVFRFTRGLAREAMADLVLPGGQVEHQLPDAVRAGDRTRRRLLPRDAFEDHRQGRPVPRIPGVFPFELVDDARNLVHGPTRSGARPDPRSIP